MIDWELALVLFVFAGASILTLSLVTPRRRRRAR